MLPLNNNIFVVDGGHLLHRVVWLTAATYNVICILYGSYVVRHYGLNVTVIVDGYSDILNTKAEEHRRRAEKITSADVIVEGGLIVTATRAQFLGNPRNKLQLIGLLGRNLREAGINMTKAFADANTLIVGQQLR